MIDFTQHDLLVTITADKKRGLWAASTFGNGTGKPVRIGGQLPAGDASEHTLLLVALANGLRYHSKPTVDKWSRARGGSKPNVKVIVAGNKTFADAIKGKIAKTKAAPVLHAGRNFVPVLAVQLSRFNLDIETSTDLRDTVLKSWVGRTLYPANSIPALDPLVVGQATNEDF
jgi:hypothetical protein